MRINAFRLGLRGKPSPAPEWFLPYSINSEGVMIDSKRLAIWGNWIIQDTAGKLHTCSDELFTALLKSGDIR